MWPAQHKLLLLKVSMAQNTNRIAPGNWYDLKCNGTQFSFEPFAAVGKLLERDGFSNSLQIYSECLDINERRNCFRKNMSFVSELILSFGFYPTFSARGSPGLAASILAIGTPFHTPHTPLLLPSAGPGWEFCTPPNLVLKTTPWVHLVDGLTFFSQKSPVL